MFARPEKTKMIFSGFKSTDAQHLFCFEIGLIRSWLVRKISWPSKNRSFWRCEAKLFPVKFQIIFCFQRNADYLLERCQASNIFLESFFPFRESAIGQAQDN